MKNFKRLGVGFLLAVMVVALSGCTLWNMIFGPSANDIMAWWPDYKVGTRLVYREYSLRTDPDLNYTGTVTVEIVDVDERENRTVVRVSVDGGTEYYIIDKDRGEIVLGGDTFIDDNDEVVLKTPVEEGNIWYTTWNYWPDTKYSISQVKATRDVPAGVYKDVVIVRLTNPDFPSHVITFELYISPTVGYLGFKIVYDQAAAGWIEEGLELQDVDEP